MLDFGPSLDPIVFSTDQIGMEDLFQLIVNGAKVTGFFNVKAFKADGSLRWKIDRLNGVTNFGFNLMLDSTFRSASISPISTWYIGLIGNTGFTTGLASGDTMSSHTGWTEDTTHYTASNRPTWTPSAASGSQITNASPVSYAINADNTIIKGIFVCSDNTLGGTSGTLWATGLFGSDQTLFNGDTLKITYAVALS